MIQPCPARVVNIRNTIIAIDEKIEEELKNELDITVEDYQKKQVKSSSLSIGTLPKNLVKVQKQKTS